MRAGDSKSGGGSVGLRLESLMDTLPEREEDAEEPFMDVDVDLDAEDDDDDDNEAQDAAAMRALANQPELLFRHWKEDDFFAPFVSESFDATEFLQKVLQGSVRMLDKLNSGIRLLDTHIHSEVVSHHADLLRQSEQIDAVENDAKTLLAHAESLKSRMTAVFESATKPFAELEACLGEAKQKQSAVEVLRHLMRLLQLVEKARERSDEVNSTGLRDLARQALIVHEIMGTIEQHNLGLIDVVRKDVDWARSQRELIRGRATRTLAHAMQEPNLADIGSALQVCFNLGEVRGCVSQVINTIALRFEEAVKAHLNMASIVEGSSPSSSRLRRLSGDSDGEKLSTGAMCRASVWARIEAALNALEQSLSEVAALQTVVDKKADVFSATALTAEGEVTILRGFWKRVVSVLSQELNVCRLSLVNSVLVGDFPRLFALFSNTFEHSLARLVGADLRTSFIDCLSALHNEFLSKNMNRTQALMKQMFAGAPKTLPTSADVSTMLKESAVALQQVQEIPELQPTMLKATAGAVHRFVENCDELCHPYATTSPLLWSQEVSERMSTIFSLLYTLDRWLTSVITGRHPRCGNIMRDAASAIFVPARTSLRNLSTQIISPFLQLCTEATRSCLRDVTYSETLTANDAAVPSGFLDGLETELHTLSTRLMRFSSRPDYVRIFLQPLLEDVVQQFTSRVSCVEHLNEMARRKVTSDIVRLEELLRMLPEGKAGANKSKADVFRTIKAFRSLLSATDAFSLLSSPNVGELPAHVVVQFCLSSSQQLKSAAALFGRTEVDYWAWSESQVASNEPRGLADALRNRIQASVNRSSLSPDAARTVDKLIEFIDSRKS